MSKVENALKVMVLDTKIRGWMWRNDPKAMKQALNALEMDMVDRSRMDGTGHNDFKSWDENTAIQFMHLNKKVKVFAGLFIYSGMGYGNYYSTDGNVYWCSTTESYNMAEEDGVDHRFRDALEGHKPVYLGD